MVVVMVVVAALGEEGKEGRTEGRREGGRLSKVSFVKDFAPTRCHCCPVVLDSVSFSLFFSRKITYPFWWRGVTSLPSTAQSFHQMYKSAINPAIRCTSLISGVQPAISCTKMQSVVNDYHQPYNTTNPMYKPTIS